MRDGGVGAGPYKMVVMMQTGVAVWRAQVLVTGQRQGRRRFIRAVVLLGIFQAVMV